jgi:hypothetical protein
MSPWPEADVARLILLTNPAPKLIPLYPYTAYSLSSRRDLHGRELEHEVCVADGSVPAASDIGAPGDFCRPRAGLLGNRSHSRRRIDPDACLD